MGKSALLLMAIQRMALLCGKRVKGWPDFGTVKSDASFGKGKLRGRRTETRAGTVQ